MTKDIKILIVDDDKNIVKLISLYLNKEGYDTKEIYSGEFVIKEFKSYNPNLILLDLMIPIKDGYEICKEIRKISKVPIIMLTAKGDIIDKVIGLELGADDYIVKPFECKELVARVKAVLRRYNNKQDNEDNGNNLNKVVYANLEINQNDYTVTYYNKRIDLPPKEFELLYYLATHPNRVFTRENLLNKIWGYEFIGDTRTVDVHIKRIREKIINKESNWCIKTVWGVGYKFEVINV